MIQEVRKNPDQTSDNIAKSNQTRWDGRGLSITWQRKSVLEMMAENNWCPCKYVPVLIVKWNKCCGCTYETHSYTSWVVQSTRQLVVSKISHPFLWDGNWLDVNYPLDITNSDLVLDPGPNGKFSNSKMSSFAFLTFRIFHMDFPVKKGKPLRGERNKCVLKICLKTIYDNCSARQVCSTIYIFHQSVMCNGQI